MNHSGVHMQPDDGEQLVEDEHAVIEEVGRAPADLPGSQLLPRLSTVYRDYADLFTGYLDACGEPGGCDSDGDAPDTPHPASHAQVTSGINPAGDHGEVQKDVFMAGSDARGTDTESEPGTTVISSDDEDDDDFDASVMGMFPVL